MDGVSLGRSVRRRATAISPRLLAHSERMEEKGEGEGASEQSGVSPGRQAGARSLRAQLPGQKEFHDEALRKLLPVSK